MKTITNHKHTSRPGFLGKRKAAATLFGSLAVVASLTFTACSDDEIGANTELAITPSTVEFNLPAELQRLVYTDETGTQCLPMIKGEAYQIPYKIEPDTITFKDVSWTSSNPDVATVDQEGNVTAVSGDGTGYSIISVMPVGYYDASGVQASLKVVVSNELVQADTITINSTADEVYGGDTLHLSAVITPANSTYKTVEWSSSDESVATVDVNGVLTAQYTEASSVPVTIKATALDGSGEIAEKVITIRQVVQPEEITIDQTYSAGNGYLCAFNERSVTLQYTTVPAQCTTSLIQWTSSDPGIATVDNGVVTFTGFGQVTITATCPETGNSSSITLNIPAGLVRETFDNPDYYLFKDAGQSGNNTATSTEWNSAGYITVTTYAQNAEKQRGDLKNQASVYLHAGNYPIIAIRMEDVKDKYGAEGVTARNITLDGSGSCNGVSFSGGLDGNNNKWLHDYKCSDGSHVFIYDLTTQSWANGGVLPADAVAEFRTFQFKYADIATIAHQLQYNVYWAQTFKTIEEVQSYIAGEGLSYDVVK